MKFYTVTVDHSSEEFDNLTNAVEHCEWAWQSYGSDSVITLVEEEDGHVWGLDPFTGEIL